MASLLRRVGAEFTANGTTAGYQWFQQIASLSGGGFVMAWIDDSWDGSLYGITAQRFDADGAKVGGEIHVNNAVFLNQLDPSVAGLASGGFVVTWTGEGNGTSSDIRGRMFDPAGLPLGPEFTVNTADTIDQQGSQAIALSGGGFVVHWVDTGAPFGGNDPNVRAQLFDSAGTKVGAEFTVNATLAGTQRETGGVALEGGGFVIVWADYSNGGPGDVKGQVFDSAGNRVGGEFMASTITAGTQWSPDVAALPGGGFVVSWQGEMVAGAQIFDSVGAKIGSEIAGSDSGTGNSVSSVNVTAVPGGAFLLAWQSTPSSFLPTVRGQLFDLAGNRIGAQFQVNEAAVGGGYMDLATLASGRIVASWNIGNYDVQGAVFRAPLIGTPAADVLVGTGDSDGIAGLASNDQLSGLGGDDVLDGGLGADLMTGGTGNDVYVVDDSGDGTIELAGEGIDGVETGLADYTLQAHVENLTGNSVAGGSQTLRGNALDNFLTGGAGSDTFHLGTAGNDVVNAGAGDDLLVVDWQDSVFDVVTGPAVIVSGTGASGGYRDGTARSVAFTGLERVNVATGSGDDVIELTRGGSSAQTGAGSDKVTLGSMIDTANGGSGIDGIAADYRDAEIGIVWDLSAGPFNGIEGFEYFLGLRTGDYNDVITTTAAARSDLIDGGRGADEINVYNGHDTVSGGTLLDFSWDTLRVDWRAYDDAVQMTLVGSLYGGSDGQILGGPDRSVVLTSFELFAILTGGGNDSLVGGSRGDILNSGGGNDILDGGAGVDMMSGGTGDDVYYASSSSDVVIEFAGAGTDEIRTGVATYSLTDLANVENLTATSNVAHDFRGNSGDNAITGGAGSDVLRLYDGGDDTVLGGAGSDNFFFIGALTAADIVNGGSEIDALVLQGPYGGLTLTANVTQIENISILGGNNTNFGEPGTNLYDYVLTTNNANFAAGVQARINGAALLAGEDFTFNGSAETDASFVVYGGKGVDTLTGGFGNDIFIYAEERFAPGDTVNGGPGGYDGIFFRGNYTIDFNAPGYNGLMTSIENMTLTSITDERYARGGDPAGFDYNITLADNQLLAGVELTVSGVLLQSYETMIVDGSLELDGTFRFFGGKSDDGLKGGAKNDLLFGNAGNDLLTGGGGSDTFRYDSTGDSNSFFLDRILDFTPGTDKIDLSRIDANSLVGGDQGFTWIGSNAFSGAAGELRAFQQGGDWMLEGDSNGDSAGDLVILLTLQGPTPLGAGDFIL